MKDIFYNLYLGRVNGIPKDEKGNEFEIVYCVENNRNISNIENNTDLNFFLIILQKTEDNLNESFEKVKTEWKDFSNLSLKLEHITDKKNRIKRNFRELLNETENEVIIFKSQAVGFDKTSKNELEQARKLILEVAIKSKWNFWN